ncbi:hypothetical protein Tco_0941139 [Tanacetum coccineum]|uniref:Uncharacterized protein n=1 Tax=Tanacetum coccineum TaxID=301880 RepID=A0ABQ5DWN5_9ASTR
MHIEKNVLESILNTLLMNDKSKDTAKARQDLKSLGIRSGLWLGQNKNGKCSKPQAAYSFKPEDRKKFCQFIKGVKLPDGFGSNFKHKVTDNDTNITGLKSHDCKSIGLRSVIRIDHQELKKVIWYVLHNSPEIDTYRAKFKSEFPDNDMKEALPGWFGKQIRQRHVDNDPGVRRKAAVLIALALWDHHKLQSQRPLGWKVVEHVSHKKFSIGGVIVVEDDPDVIHVDNSSDLALSTVEWTCGGCLGVLAVDGGRVMMSRFTHSTQRFLGVALGKPRTTLGDRWEMPVALPSWRQSANGDEGGGHGSIGTQFDMRPHMESDRGHFIYAAILRILQKDLQWQEEGALKEGYNGLVRWVLELIQRTPCPGCQNETKPRAKSKVLLPTRDPTAMESSAIGSTDAYPYLSS